MEIGAIMTIIMTVLLQAVKQGPDAVAAVKDFIKRLNETEWTKEKLEELVADMKPPEEYTGS